MRINKTLPPNTLITVQASEIFNISGSSGVSLLIKNKGDNTFYIGWEETANTDCTDIVKGAGILYDPEQYYSYISFLSPLGTSIILQTL